MGIANVVPVFLDDSSGFTEKQIEAVNILAKTARNSFTSKAKQKQLPKPEIKNIIRSRYSRTLDVKNYLYGTNFSIQFILNPYNMSSGIEYSLFELENKVTRLQFEGSHSSTYPSKLLSSLGTIKYKVKDGKDMIVFECTSDDWPVDENNRRVQFSVYIGGSIS